MRTFPTLTLRRSCRGGVEVSCDVRILTVNKILRISTQNSIDEREQKKERKKEREQVSSQSTLDDNCRCIPRRVCCGRLDGVTGRRECSEYFL
jgi:hypothetical protein